MSKKKILLLTAGIVTLLLVGTPFVLRVTAGLNSMRHPCVFSFEDFKKSLYLDHSFLKTDYCGGDTPEETARLFTLALRANDFNLAVRYFVPGNPYPEQYMSMLAKRYSTPSATYYLQMLDALVERGQKQCRQEKYFDFKDAPAVELCEMGFDNSDGGDASLRNGHAALSMIKNPYTNKWHIF